MPTRPTPRRARPTSRQAGPLAGLVLLLACLGVAAAPSAAAVEDSSRPQATVLEGPSCRPGGVQIEVASGTVGYSVTLATTRHPEGEDAAEVRPGETVVLRTGDVAWGETIDSRLEYTALDGSGDTYADDLEPYSFTRPAQEDCAAIGSAPAAPPDGTEEPTELPPADGASATGLGQRPGPPPGGGPDLQVQAAAEDRPLDDGTRSAWTPAAAVLALAGTAGGLAVLGRLRAAVRRPGA